MNKLAINGGEKSVSLPVPHYKWPNIDDKIEKVVIEQLHKTISIYDKSGIFEEFENNFSNYHGLNHSLLFNSGTSAIFAMFESIGLGPGDEILCPNYTFFATISPITYNGAFPIPCDCDKDGNIDPNEILKKITSKTKAIIITHMWGIPCNMDLIVNICKENNLLLLEDCSHAHGAEYKGKKVGTFGDIAAWSLQGKKTLTGGEGGVLSTNNEEYYYKSLLLGHYNKRSSSEIPLDHDYHKYSTTGFGLKLRAHPLAIAIANDELSRLDTYLQDRNEFASYMINEVNDISFLQMPNFDDKLPSWYAFVMQYNQDEANGILLEKFYEALICEGLDELDIPFSTSLIHNFDLFKELNNVNPRLYKENIKTYTDIDFPNSVKFYNNALKLPVWNRECDKEIVEKYVEGIKKVAYYVVNEPGVFKK
ncbi:MAG: DegT/DnrJ/EryC1/StrS family aminotransferase [Candidatus Gracilibacteria bacterium]|nr:DegT/DnrJ/EryC1/StrS family aminotransferase [Candidatus Gracilibacteria bacterium]